MTGRKGNLPARAIWGTISAVSSDTDGINETETEVTTRDGVRLHILCYEADAPGKETSPARNLLLLHGWPNAGRVWRRLAENILLADPRFRLYAPDLRGYGASDKPGAGYHCVTFADDVEDIAAGLGLASAGYALVGHSMSGKVAQTAAARRPPGLEALVLVTPGMLAASPPVDISGRKAIYGNAAQVRDMMTGWAAYPIPEGDIDLLVEDALRAGRDAWNGWLSPMRDEDLSGVAESISVPALVIGGGRDPQRTEGELRRGVVQQIAGAEYARLPNSGHLPHLEEPEALAALIVNFLDDAVPPSGPEPS